MRGALVLVLWASAAAAAKPSTCTIPGCDADCQAGDASACRRLGEWRARVFGADRANPAYARGCSLGDATSCGLAGDLAGACKQGSGWSCWKAHDPRAAAIARAGCDAGDGDDCFALAGLTPDGDVRVLALQARACDLGVPEACAARASLAVAADEKRLYQAYACAGGLTSSCIPPASMPAPPIELQTGIASQPASLAAAAPATTRPSGRDKHVELGLAAEKTKQYAAAWSHYETACTAGDPFGCDLLGFLAEHGLPTLDVARAVDLYRGACRDGEMKGCYDLGRLTLEGKGVAEDDHHAGYLFELACDSPDAYGCGELARLVREGRVPEIARVATDVAGRGCERDDPIACETLGELLEDGAQSPARIIDAYDRACEAGSGAACLRAGILFANGDIVDRDDLKASFYFTLGCSHDDAEPCRHARELLP